jgi:hypothetical protein
MQDPFTRRLVLSLGRRVLKERIGVMESFPSHLLSIYSFPHSLTDTSKA